MQEAKRCVGALGMPGGQSSRQIQLQRERRPTATEESVKQRIGVPAAGMVARCDATRAKAERRRAMERSKKRKKGE